MNESEQSLSGAGDARSVSGASATRGVLFAGALFAGVLGLGLGCDAPRSGSAASQSRAFERGSRPDAASDASVAGGSVAPGAPGVPSVWGPSLGSFVGTATSDVSRVYFTGQRGAIAEVFYPELDRVQTIALELLIGDDTETFVDSEAEAAYTAERPEPHSLRWRVTTEHPEHGWRLTKEVFTDPGRDALVVRGTLEASGGRDLSSLRLYARHDPALGNSGAGDSSVTRRVQGRTFLVASEDGQASALGVSLPWVEAEAVGARAAMVSNGFAGRSDAASDLSGDHHMDARHRAALDGNVEQLGWIDLGAGAGAGSAARRFDLVLGFGPSERVAIATARATLDDDLDALARQYDAGWQSYTRGLDDQGGEADDQYYLSAMTLRTLRDKQSGALVAGMATPWGPSRGDDDNGGYHLVWPRDLFQLANAALSAGDVATARGAVRYLFDVLVQTTDCGRSEADAAGCPHGYSRRGRFPQNAWLDGDPFWTSTQLDEQALPILLAWRLREHADATLRREIEALWPRMRPTAEFILEVGPWTQQERWEESSGYSPSTIAAEIAGLVAAADLARAAGDRDSAARYLAVADYWEENVAAWTFTTTGPHGNQRYFIRLNPSKRRGGEGLARYAPEAGPDVPLTFTINNGGGEHDQRAIVDAGFLQLVRLGVKAADDPAIVDSLPELDAIIKQSIPGKGDGWFRYNFDGYGETNAGAAWDGVNGRGRLWPIFSAERGMYEIARQGRGAAGAPYLAMLRAFATPEGFIPEQVWPLSTSGASIGSAGWDVITPEPFVPGTPTESIAPLGWAMGEYVSLLASVHAGAPVDVPAVVCRRYDTCAPPLAPGDVRVTFDIRATLGPGERLYVSGDAASLGDSSPGLGVPARRIDAASHGAVGSDGSDGTAAGHWRAVFEAPAGRALSFRLDRRNPDGSWTHERAGGGNGRRWTPRASGPNVAEFAATF
ncbi:MAG TPA: glycoside hydrolase family 15 protein [Polyangiaceae bacterium]|nr:glycoside hydrolase family 15 protein [Polyangiaceae bacterium]